MIDADAKQEISEVLARYGLSVPEQSVYLALIAESPLTLSPLATRLDVPVSTVQSIIKRLMEKGIVVATKRGSRHHYAALPPETLKKQTERLLEELAGIMPFLKEIREEPSARIGVRVLYREHVRTVFYEILEAKDRIIYEIVSPRDLQRVLGEKMHFNRRRVAKGLALKSLRVASEEIKNYTKERNRLERREVRFLPPSCTFVTSLFIWDQSVAFFSRKEEGIGVVITSPSLTLMLRQWFDILWSVSRIQ